MLIVLVLVVGGIGVVGMLVVGFIGFWLLCVGFGFDY